MKRIHQIRVFAFLLALAAMQATVYAQRVTSPTLTADRIVSLSAAATEALFALGAGEKVLAIGNSSQWPKEALKKPRVGGILEAQIEQIAGMKPDLVILTRDYLMHMRPLRERGVRTLTIQGDSINDAMWAIHDLSFIVGKQRQAKNLLDKMVERLNALHNRYALGERPQVMMVLYHEDPPFDEVLALAPDNYLDEILRVAGGENVVKTWDIEGGLTVRLTGREIRSAAPEVIIDLRPDEMNAEQRQAVEAQWKELAPKSRVVVVHEPYLGVPGVQIPDSVETLAKWIHGPFRSPATAATQAASTQPSPGGP